MKPKNDTYSKEHEILRKAQEYLDTKALSKEALWYEYELLTKEYKQLLSIATKITNISDKHHRKLMVAYEALEKQNAVLEEAATLREDIARITRHDLKTPLHGIIGFSSLLLDGDTQVDEEQKEMLNGIKESGYQILEMINRSHDLYKMETGNYRYQAVPVDILFLFRKIVKENRSIIESKRLTIEISLNGRQVTDDDTFTVEGEYLLCYSMFANLFRNAIEASPNGLPITISLAENEVVTVTIHNQGAIPEEIRDRFFEKYVTAGKANGTGLGTYSAKLMVETQGGSIHFNTSDTFGTAISVCLPKLNG